MEEPYLLHPISVSYEICFVGFQIKSSFCSKNLSSIQDLCRFGMHFSAWDSSFFFVKNEVRPYFAMPFLKAQIYFHDFFLLVRFQDEVKQLSSWKFFYWNRFGNRFGNDVSRLKKY